MSEVTDKMVQAARKSLSECSIALGGLPTAIEAALAAREPVDVVDVSPLRVVHLVTRMRSWAKVIKNPSEKSYPKLSDDCVRAADAIDELAEALKPLAVLYVDDSDYSYTDISTYEGNVLTASCVRNARAILTRMGVKL